MTEIKEKAIIKTEIDKLYRYALIFGAIFFGWMSYLTSSVFNQKPPELIGIVIFFVFIGFGLWSLIGFWAYFDNITIFYDRLEAKNFGGFYNKTIFFTDIVDTKTSHKQAKYNSWDELTIMLTNNKKYKIYSTSYKNYHQLEHFIRRKQGIKYNQTTNKSDKNKVLENIIIYSFLSICIFGLLYFYKKSEEFEVDKDSLVSIELTLDNKPAIKSGSKGSKSLELSIREYPDFQFNISGFAYKATQISNLVENTEGGSQVILTIEKEDYLQKLIQTKELTFWKKYFSYRNISVYGIKDKKLTYLSVAGYEAENRDDYKWCVFGILGFLLYFGYVAWDEQKKKSKTGFRQKKKE